MRKEPGQKHWKWHQIQCQISNRHGKIENEEMHPTKVEEEEKSDR